MKRLTILPAALLASALTTTSVYAQQADQLKPAVDAAAKINESAAQSQTTINGITDQISDKLQAF